MEKNLNSHHVRSHVNAPVRHTQTVNNEQNGFVRYKRGDQNQKSVIPIYFKYFWALSPKIIVVLAENQYLGHFKGVMTS